MDLHLPRLFFFAIPWDLLDTLIGSFEACMGKSSFLAIFWTPFLFLFGLFLVVLEEFPFLVTVVAPFRVDKVQVGLQV